jgi:hypothetical protein
MTSFTPHQDSALKAVADWLKAKPGKNGTPPVFRLFGYAGTGKTTLARHVAEAVDGEAQGEAAGGAEELCLGRVSRHPVDLAGLSARPDRAVGTDRDAFRMVEAVDERFNRRRGQRSR